MGNYRLKLMICNFATNLEKIINERLITFLEGNTFLSENQYGFKRRLGTIDAVMFNVSKYIYNMHLIILKKLQFFSIFAKAYIVDHKELLNSSLDF